MTTSPPGQDKDQDQELDNKISFPPLNVKAKFLSLLFSEVNCEGEIK